MAISQPEQSCHSADAVAALSAAFNFTAVHNWGTGLKQGLQWAICAAWEAKALFESAPQHANGEAFEAAQKRLQESHAELAGKYMKAYRAYSISWQAAAAVSV